MCCMLNLRFAESLSGQTTVAQSLVCLLCVTLAFWVIYARKIKLQLEHQWSPILDFATVAGAQAIFVASCWAVTLPFVEVSSSIFGPTLYVISAPLCGYLTQLVFNSTKKGSRSSWRHEQQLQQRAAATQIFGTLVVLTVVGMSQVLTLRHVPFWLFFALSAASLFLSARVAARVAVRPLQQPGQAPKTASSPRTLSPPPRARFSVWHVAVAVLVMLLLGTTLLGAVRHAFDLATGGAVGTTTVSLSQRTWQQRAALSVSLLCWPLIVGGVALLCLALPSLTDRSSSYRRITSHNEQHLLVSERVAAFLNRETPRFDIQSITSLAAACVTLPVILAMHWRARDAFLHLSENESIDTVTSLRAYLLQLCHLAALTGFMLLAGVSATRLMLHSVSHAFRKSLLSSFD